MKQRSPAHDHASFCASFSSDLINLEPIQNPKKQSDRGWAVDQAILAEEERVVIIRFGHDWDDTCMQRERKMSYLLPHLHSGWAVDQAILAEEERLVVIRFGHDWDETCMQMDEVLASVAETIKNFAVIYLVDITEVPDFNTMYELYDPSTVMFFFRNKHIMIDLGTGNNNKINWALKDKQEFIDIVETVYRGARKGRGLVIAPKDYSTKENSINRSYGRGMKPIWIEVRTKFPISNPEHQQIRLDGLSSKELVTSLLQRQATQSGIGYIAELDKCGKLSFRMLRTGS
ncbi:unnamed protein product [Dovyalis caffra]|uniref:Mitosis protein dim1 n=1 Tax=Dovyalis caffra TaxID=77055 RepID=A0AAV1SLN7_9ROSI|nr:unnamed protein product [Dovyalis caffra]